MENDSSQTIVEENSEKKGQTIPLPPFDTTFPSILNLTLYQKLSEQSLSLFQTAMEKVIPRWSIFRKNKDYKDIAEHVYCAMRSLQHDQMYQALPYVDQQTALWTMILHDIGKRADPDISNRCAGRDPAHPFHSAQIALHELVRLKVLQLPEERIRYWDLLFANAFRIDQIRDMEVHNMDQLPEIYLFIDKQIRPEYLQVKDVLKLILMHQLIPCSTYPPVTPLRQVQQQLPSYFNRKLLHLMHIFWVNDSLSYQDDEFVTRAQRGDNFVDVEIKQIMEDLMKILDY